MDALGGPPFLHQIVGDVPGVGDQVVATLIVLGVVIAPEARDMDKLTRRHRRGRAAHPTQHDVRLVVPDFTAHRQLGS